MKKYLVTGGAGFIGSHIATALLARNDQVRVFDNFSTGFRQNLAHVAGQVEIFEGDVSDHSAVTRAVQGVDCIFHQAALASVPLSIERPLDVHAACATGTLNVLDAARRAGVKRVVYAASSSAYGDQPGDKKSEIDLPSVLSPYAAAKLTGELYCQAFYHSYGLETVALRYFNVFGPRQDPASPYSAVIPLFVTAIVSGKTPVIFGDGGQTRDFVYVENVAQANLLAADSPGVGGKMFNVGNGQSTSLLELIATLNELLGANIQPEHREARVGDVRHSMADISLARQLIGYEPKFSFREGLRRTIDYYKSIVKLAATK